MKPVMTVTMLVILMILSTVSASFERLSSKPDTHKCCMLSEIYVEEAPGVRVCRPVSKIGGFADLNPLQWQDHQLKDFVISHVPLECGEGEQKYQAYHHDDYQGQTESLELLDNGTLVVSWGEG